MGLILEYEGKEIFRKYKLPLADYILVQSADEAVNAANKLGLPVVVKAQVLSGKRGKRGLIKFAKTAEDVAVYAKEIMTKESDGRPINYLLIEKASNIASELFISMLFDPDTLDTVILFSMEGGVDIESLAENRPEAIEKFTVPFGDEVFPHNFIYGLSKRGVPKQHLRTIGSIMATLVEMMRKEDLQLAEINPLVITKEDKVIALDSKVGTDDDAMFRHPERANYISQKMRYTKEEAAAKAKDLSYVDLGGDIGMLSCGAGMGMATADLIQEFGGEPRNFLDVGGGASPEKVAESLRIMVSAGGLKSILINAFGGITKLDDVAKGIIDAKEKYNIDIPLVIRFNGTNQKEGMELLTKYGLDTYLEMEPAIQKVVEVSGEGL